MTNKGSPPHGDTAANNFLWLEFLSLFGLVPVAYATGIIPLPRIPLLLAIFLGCLGYLLKNKHYDKTELLNGISGNRQEIRAMLLRACLVALGAGLLVMAMEPAQLFGFPRQKPLLWLAVMILYPLVSAYPQELIYRAFLFHRYRPILKSETATMWASILAFAFLHIIFGNWLAVALTIPAGYLFARVYVKTGSLLMASIEHALYGCIIFTVGLGKYFYSPS
ncbi:CPBP family intramembrane glutamic endopeptidase [Pseudodesulfovibrio senegalensis]|jgi:membrane protease YdiL (CAAX protease family)|uniref:CPBP family intramembrane metalloprotease n=1 Tax=Pseudodesulfovibrio senegalensis TaxID=1721087 RepID=A0A6N6N005_9BACT|nr:CPBP family intramembrane glutamic endopeptidase [Pseudodesulfovibrio senegalensis]KAB1440275.1 CPBP family intramembrane metalloprotease [Pseudodesulfovibrio senegalensis]